jgi:alkylation response protein AidB-like acyl-CoA dehydrogenase
MNFDFSDDQKLLKEQVRKFLADKCPLKVPRRVLEGEETYAKEVWRGLAELGVLGAAIPESYGGLGLGAFELCVVAEELGRAAAPVPVSSSIYLVAEAIKRFGSEAQKQKWLPKLASGEAIGALATSEGAQPANPRTVKTTLAGGKLTGVKLPVVDGEAATIAVVLANSGGSGDRALSLALVDMSASGITRARVETVDPTRKQARIVFAQTPAETLGALGEGWRLLEELYDAAAVILAFEQIGGAEAAMWMARDYALERQAFGRQIGSYQGIKHKLADMYIKLELARSNAYYAAMMLNDAGADLPLAAAAARVAAIDAYTFAAQENVQTHGGIGFTWEADTQFHYRRSKLLALTLGGPMAWKDKLVARLEKRNKAA